ncbi:MULTISPECIES: hypothetical protein [Clostridium]|uniref:hypothetical protein n=1 Tax=Clostridium TaxID=1485 RepID=UPI0008265DCE|nr:MULTISPECIES: hypothetical protein [Clostridium]PJI09323.1 hypothetical protein CUB90_16200 [Clostridium sp. CT7]
MNIFKKHKFVWVCFIIVVFLLTVFVCNIDNNSKNAFFQVGAIESSGMHKYDLKYFYLNGNRSKVIKLKTNEQINIEYSSIVKAGKLKILFLDPSGKVIKNLLVDNSGAFKYTAKREGKYSLQITARKTRGQFNLDWDTKSK